VASSTVQLAPTNVALLALPLPYLLALDRRPPARTEVGIVGSGAWPLAGLGDEI